MIVFNFRFAFRRARLNRRSSNLVCILTLTIDEQKALFNSVGKKIPKRVGAMTQPRFTPLFIVNDSETIILNNCLRVGVKRLQNVKEV